MPLCLTAQVLAAEIAAQDWSDAHIRLDGAQHNRATDSKADPADPRVLDADDVDSIRWNVAVVTAQSLMYRKLLDWPDLHEYVLACGVSPRRVYNRDGEPSGAINYAIRTNATGTILTAWNHEPGT